jgi:hypothetical protein
MVTSIRESIACCLHRMKSHRLPARMPRQALHWPERVPACLQCVDGGGRSSFQGSVRYQFFMWKSVVHWRKPCHAVVFARCRVATEHVSSLDRTRPNRAQHYDPVNDFGPFLFITLDLVATYVSKKLPSRHALRETLIYPRSIPPCRDVPHVSARSIPVFHRQHSLQMTSRVTIIVDAFDDPNAPPNLRQPMM